MAVKAWLADASGRTNDMVYSTITSEPVFNTTNKKFGISSAYLPGGGIIGVPDNADLDFGTGDFTIEFWSKPIITTVACAFYSTFSAYGAGGYNINLDVDGTIQFKYGSSANEWLFATTKFPGYASQTFTFSNTTSYEYYRIRLDTSINTEGWALIEVEMRETSTGADVLSGGTPTAESTYSTYVASRACDNNLATYWAANATPPTTQWWQYQLASAKTVTEVTIVPYLGRLSDFTFFGSNDGSNWDEIGTDTYGGAPENWVHLAVVRNSGILTIYINGVSSGSKDISGVNINAAAAQGALFGRLYSDYAVNYYFNGYIDEARILKGTAAWTTDFTPPSVAYTDATKGANCVLLAHFDDLAIDLSDNVKISEFLPDFSAFPLALTLYDGVTVKEQSSFPLAADQSVFRGWTGWTDEGPTTTGGQPIVYTEEGRKEDFGFPLNKKLGGEVEIVLRSTDAIWYMQVHVSFDDGSYYYLGKINMYSSEEDDITQKFHLDSFGAWRHLRVKLVQDSRTSNEDITVLETNLVGFVEEFESEE